MFSFYGIHKVRVGFTIGDRTIYARLRNNPFPPLKINQTLKVVKLLLKFTLICIDLTVKVSIGIIGNRFGASKLLLGETLYD